MTKCAGELCSTCSFVCCLMRCVPTPVRKHWADESDKKGDRFVVEQAVGAEHDAMLKRATALYNTLFAKSVHFAAYSVFAA